jgi:hypothetical protein
MDEYILDNYLIKFNNDTLDIINKDTNKKYKQDLNNIQNIEYKYYHKNNELEYDKNNKYFNFNNINSFLKNKINEKNIFLETNNNECSIYLREDYIKTKPDEPRYNKYYMCKINIPSI